MIKRIESILIFTLITLLSITLLLRFIHIETKVVQSDSMYPTVRKNDLVYINHGFDITKIKVGDIITFNLGDKEVMHRVVLITGDMITTKGDNNKVVDQSILKGQITGKMIIKVPYGGYLLNLGLWVIIIGAYGVIYISRKIIHEFRKE